METVYKRPELLETFRQEKEDECSDGEGCHITWLDIKSFDSTS